MTIALLAEGFGSRSTNLYFAQTPAGGYDVQETVISQNRHQCPFCTESETDSTDSRHLRV